MSADWSGRSFGHLRSKLLNVQQELTSSWISLSEPSPSSPTAYIPTLSSKQNSPIGGFGSSLDSEVRQLSINCGSELLHKWKNSWKEIHETSEENYEAARKVERIMVGIHGSLEKQQITFSQLNKHLINLPVLQEQVYNLTAKIGSLCEDFDILEAGLFELENLSQTVELQKQMEQQRLALQQHRERRNLDLEKDKVAATLNHEQKMKEYETRLHHKLLERQMVFEAEFHRDLTAFKEKRKIEDEEDTTVVVEEEEPPSNPSEDGEDRNPTDE